MNVAARRRERDDWRRRRAAQPTCDLRYPGPIRYHCPPVALSGPPVTLSGAAAPSGSRTAKRKMMKHNDFLRAAAALTVTLGLAATPRSEEHTSDLQSLMRISYAVFCLTKKKTNIISNTQPNT